ncbi:hypothetical protein BDY19DRAFT_998271 [Irpex rosettiformis]|uniref:Uncharacterized protein n=1 Tax=Irpex rosettiformis TaxID=378272 RepID=A0ACB8TP37_9APHY|nr:hypothetical protein BDY19DRAFT_998271 [Irpex rosettiformis]
MTSSATKLPAEILDNIVFLAADTSRLWHFDTDLAARQEEMRNLSACALTCVRWAQVIRVPMYATLVLRSAEDFRTLRCILHTPSGPRIPPISDYLTSLVVFYKLADYPWFHGVQWLQTDGAHRLQSLKLHIGGPVPVAFTNQLRLTISHPLFYCAPRVVPFPRFKNLHITISLQDIHFANYTTLLNLLSDLYPLRSSSIYCQGLTWDKGPPTLHSEMTVSVCGGSTLRDSTATSCTDDIMVNAAIHCHTRRAVVGSREWQRFLGPSDSVPLFRVMRLFYDNAASLSFDDSGPVSVRLWSVGCCEVAEEYFPIDLTRLYLTSIISSVSGSPIGFSCLTGRSELHANSESIQCFLISIRYNTFQTSYYLWLKHLQGVLYALDWDLLISTVLKFPDLDCIAVQCDLYQGLVELVNCWQKHLSRILDVIWPRNIRLYYEDGESNGLWHEIGYDSFLRRLKVLGPHHEAPDIDNSGLE